MDSQKLGRTIVSVGYGGLIGCVFWWATFYSIVIKEPGGWVAFLPCLVSSSGTCGFATWMMSWVSPFPYQPIFWWISWALIVIGLVIQLAASPESPGVPGAAAGGNRNYDANRWNALVQVDPEISAAVARVKPFGRLAEAELASKFLVLNDKQYLATLVGQVDSKYSAQGAFKDIDIGPEMVVVPAGSFMMGSNKANERPPHEVTIKAPFAVGRYAVTFTEWDAAGLPHKPDDAGWGRGLRPVINVSWDDAKAYANWLSQKTGKEYRLLSEAEWEYCCRAGTTTNYAFGDRITPQQAQFSDKQTAEVGAFPPNAWGLCDMHGNVWEWCEDS